MTDPSNIPPIDTEGPQDDVRQYIQELRNTPAPETMIYGMVKPAQNDNGIMFAHAGDCANWIFISKTAIQKIKSTGQLQCGGGSYALAAIQLKAPRNDLEKAFSDVANLHRTKLAQITSSATVSAPPQITCPAGTTLVRDQWGNWICAPSAIG